MGNLSELKAMVFRSDDRACFIERERILAAQEREMADYEAPDRPARIFAKLMAGASTPICPHDYFAGRMVEALPDQGMQAPNVLICSPGHMSPDYERLLRLGLGGILAQIEATAARKGDAQSAEFAANARIVVTAIRDYARRYADAARGMGLPQMAQALERVPYEPAYDFYSALQSVWLIHMIASCYVGARDYAFGRFDQYMLPYYRQALAEGCTEEALTELLAGFFMKTNEICGRATHNHECKPIRCQASKQYVNIGGEAPNEFSFTVLNAARLANMAQPQIVVLLQPEADPRFTDAVFEALAVLTDKMNIYNYSPIVAALVRKGIPLDVAKDFTYSACCTFDLNYHSFRREYFVPVPQIFLEVLHRQEYDSLEALTEQFRQALTADMQRYADLAQRPYPMARARKAFVLDSLLLTDSAVNCRYPCDGESRFNVLNLFCPGVATIGDSLMVLDKLVFREKRYTYRQFSQILQENYVNHKELRREILGCTMFGNDDPDVDRYTALAGKIFLDAADELELKANYYAAPGFYSLERDNTWREQVGATPNGRLAGEPFSENQSPTYGADKQGLTALLKSLGRLPFDRTVTGGLNLTFSRNMTPENLQALVLAYFQMGGLHAGISVIDRDTLIDAMARPEKYQSLTVRLYGFSEYFVSLPVWQQLAILERTEY